MNIVFRNAAVLGAITMSLGSAAAQQTGGERDILPQAQAPGAAKGQAHCPL